MAIKMPPANSGVGAALENFETKLFHFFFCELNVVGMMCYLEAVARRGNWRESPLAPSFMR